MFFWDRKFYAYLMRLRGNKYLDRIMPLVTLLGDGGFIWICFTVTLFFWPQYRSIAIMTAVSIMISLLLGNFLIKNLVRRPRPFITLQQFDLLIKTPPGYSFPSSHTAVSFAAAGVLARLGFWQAVVAFVIAILIGLSRIYLRVHYPLDVLVGIVLGLICSVVVQHIFLSFILV